MTDDRSPDLGAPSIHGGGASPGESPETPTRALVRATANLNRRGELIRRDYVYDVDLTIEATKEDIRRGWLVVLPANQQPHNQTGAPDA